MLWRVRRRYRYSRRQIPHLPYMLPFDSQFQKGYYNDNTRESIPKRSRGIPFGLPKPRKTMKIILLSLLALLGYSPSHTPSVVSAIEEMAPDEETARILLVWGHKESGLRNDAIGDGGRARCFLQLRDRGNLDPQSCIRVWLYDLSANEKLCGSRRAALGALSSGRCGGATKLVSSRLKLAGVVLP
jgi:hypothetical protein